MIPLRPIVLFAVALLTATVAPCAAEQPGPIIETQVLRIFSTQRTGYYHKPWKSPDFAQTAGSGFFFRDDRIFPGRSGLILTNAHVVNQAQSIQVCNGREKRRYTVKPVGVCHPADFAVLELEPQDLATYEQRNGPIKPLDLADSDTLRVGDRVLGWGYPLGGERISKSEQGEISRIEVNRYGHSGESWLMVQASLQQNRGNSGGPILKDDKVVGVAFQGIRPADRINYFIPINLIKRLVPTLENQERISQWRYVIQFMFPKLKEYYRLAPDDGGVLLEYIIPDGGPYRFGLRANDILVDIDGHSIDNYGEVFFQPLGQRVLFSEVLKRKLVGDMLTMSVIRDGKTVAISGALTPGLPRLVSRVFEEPSYFIFGGVGFVELTLNCIENLQKSGESLKARYVEKFPERPYQKIVLVSEVFPEYGITETSSFLNRVEKIDGEEVLNAEWLYKKIQELKKSGKKWAMLEIAENARLPLNLEGAAEVDCRIQEKYGIRYMKTRNGLTD